MRTALLVLLTLCLSMPAASHAQSDAASDPFLTPSGFDVQGHRGARGLAPENTLPAFRTALDLGVTTLEMDLAISQDGQVVVSHEPWMSHVICRTPDGERIPEGEAQSHNLYAMPYERVAQYDCGSLAHPEFPEQENEPARKPLLREVIELAEDRVDLGGRDRPVFYNVEIKSRPAWEGRFHPAPDAFAQAVYDMLESEGVLRRTTVQSFDPRALVAMHAIDSDVRLAMLVSRGFNPGMQAFVDSLGFVPDIYSPDHRLVDEDLLAEAEERGMQVIPWTVNEGRAMRRLIALGVDGLITDYPDRAQRVLQAAE